MSGTIARDVTIYCATRSGAMRRGSQIYFLMTSVKAIVVWARQAAGPLGQAALFPRLSTRQARAPWQLICLVNQGLVWAPLCKYIHTVHR